MDYGLSRLVENEAGSQRDADNECARKAWDAWHLFLDQFAPNM